MTMTPFERVTEVFIRHHGRPQDLTVRAPGRVNLIGEHTAYNDVTFGSVGVAFTF